MESTGTHIAAPIFVVGSPRSGTSILTWCLGQHPNIVPQEESDWLGQFALSVGAHHAIGSARGERSQLAPVVECGEFFRNFGDAIDRLILDHRNLLEHNNWLVAQRDPAQITAGFSLSRGEHEPKRRWVDGTPEYSLYICGLHKLFPAAKFVHIVRDVREVTTSMLNFHRPGGVPLVESEQEAFEYWLRTVRACVRAEQALGGAVVYRIAYSDLIQRTEPALRKLFAFLGEPFAPACLEPLARRINSSGSVPASTRPGAHADPGLVECATQLSEQLQQSGFSLAFSAAARAEFEAEFDASVQFVKDLDANYQIAQDIVHRLGTEIERSNQVAQEIIDKLHAQLDQSNARLKKMVNWCGGLLAVQLLCAVTVILHGGVSPATRPALAWLAASSFGMIAYAWLRRAGLRVALKRILGRSMPA